MNTNISNDPDLDNDGIADVCDDDDDNDGITDLNEGCNDFISTFPEGDKGYLFQGTEVFTVDIQTGIDVKIATLPTSYNAVTINEETGKFWAINQSTNLLEVLNPYTFSVEQTFSGVISAISAAYDPIRKRYVANNGSSFKIVDADPSSANYGTLLYNFSTPTNINDLAYNSDDGYMYGIRNGRLYQVNVDAETVTDMGNVSGFSGGAGAAYSTNDGKMYFSENSSGNIYVMDLANTGNSVTLFSNGSASSSNDGAKALGVDLNGNPLCLDTDNDGILNSCDLDSDNDGCPDAIEGGGTFTYQDINPDGTLTSSVDGDGFPSQVGGTSQGVGTSANPSTNACCDATISNAPDKDSDGIADICDLDDDNDGISDIDEGCSNTFNFPNADKGFLFQGTEVFTVNIQTGISVKVADLPTGYNAVAVNEETGTFWAINQSTNLLEVLSPNTFNVEQTFSPTINAISAAYDPMRKLYIANNGNSFKVVDANPNSSTYGNLLYSFQTSFNINDLAYNSDDGYLYGIRNGTLYQVDVVGQAVNTIGSVSGFSGGAGAAYATYDGRMFFSENSSGNIYVMDLANTGNSVTLFSNGPASSSNDGAKVLGVDLNGDPLCLDTDGDGIPNNCDLDSDDDGCPDAIEGGGNFTYQDLDNDGRLTGNTDSDGFPNQVNGNSQGVGSSQDATLTICVEICDNGIDDDGDGLIDCADPDCGIMVISTISANETCSQGNGSITITFLDNPNQTGIQFSINGGASWNYTTPDNVVTFTINNLSAGNYDLRARWDDGTCPIVVDNNIVIINENNPTTCNPTILFQKSTTTDTAGIRETVIFTFTIFNNAGATLNNVTFTDILSNGGVFYSDAFDLTNGIQILGASINTNTANFTLNNVQMGSSSFKLAVDIPAGLPQFTNYCNQASISNLKASNPNLPDTINSDDPSTTPVDDPTCVLVRLHENCCNGVDDDGDGLCDDDDPDCQH